MRVGQSPYSAHQAGMSALWHDADYLPEKRFETPIVQKGLQDMALPTEEHQLPEGVPDPFQKLDAVFEAAALQMEKGLVGQAFLHGKSRSLESTADPMRHVDDQTATLRNSPQKGSVIDQKIIESIRTDLDAARLTNQAAATPITTAKNATRTAAEKEALDGAAGASSVGDVLGNAATFMPMAAGQAVQGVVQGPLPSLASQAVTITSAVASAGQVAAVGLAEGLREDEPVVVKRGLSKAKDKIEKG
jgi:hypothetical protein